MHGRCKIATNAPPVSRVDTDIGTWRRTLELPPRRENTSGLHSLECYCPTPLRASRLSCQARLRDKKVRPAAERCGTVTKPRTTFNDPSHVSLYLVVYSKKLWTGFRRDGPPRTMIGQPAMLRVGPCPQPILFWTDLTLVTPSPRYPYRVNWPPGLNGHPSPALNQVLLITCGRRLKVSMRAVEQGAGTCNEPTLR